MLQARCTTVPRYHPYTSSYNSEKLFRDSEFAERHLLNVPISFEHHEPGSVKYITSGAYFRQYCYCSFCHSLSCLYLQKQCKTHTNKLYCT